MRSRSSPARVVIALLGAVLAIFVGVLVWFEAAQPATSPTRTGDAASGGGVRAAAPSFPASEPGRTTAGGEVTESDPAPGATGSLRIRTVDATGRVPFAAVGVVVELDDGATRELAPRWVVTDGAGLAELTALPVGVAHLRADRGATADCPIDAGEVTTQVLTIPAGVDVDGTVVTADGQPLPFASIVVGTLGGNRFGHVVGQADAQGRFAVQDLPPGAVYVGAIHADHHPSTMEPLIDRAIDTPFHVELRMRGPGAVVLGTVVGADGVPLADAVVRMGGTYGEPEIRISRERYVGGYAPRIVRSGADGTFRMDGLAADDVEFLVQARGHASLSTFEALAPGVNRVEFRLGEGCRVAGRVLHTDGDGLAGVRVTAHAFDPWQDVSAISRPDGGFVLDGCDPSRIEVEARRQGFVELHVNDVKPNEPLRLVLQAERTLEGHVVDAAGRPLGGWAVMPPVGRPVRSGDDGAFAVIADDIATLRVGPPRPRVPIVPTVERDARGFVLRVPGDRMPTAMLVGHVVTSDGAPRADASVVVAHAGEFVFGGRADPTDGSFRIGPFLPGAYVVRVTGSAADEPPFAIESAVTLVSGEERDLGELRPARSTPPGRLRVTLARRDGIAVEHAGGRVFDAATNATVATLLLSASDGREQALLPGEYRFGFWSSNAASTVQPFTIRSGEETVVALDLAPAARRSVFGPWPVPPGFPTAGAVRCVIRDATGQIAADEDLDAASLPGRIVPTLAASTFELELRCADGQRFVGRFTVPSIAPSRAPIVVSVDAVR